MNDIESLRLAVEKMHHCQACHQRTEHVREKFRGKTVWEGDVDVFTVTGAGPAIDCFAWHHSEMNGKRTRIVTVLGIPPVVSPQAAVRAAHVSDLKQEQAK